MPRLLAWCFEDRRVRSRRGRLDARAISHASQKCLVRKVFLLKVRRKHNELLKRNFNLLSCVQREIVDASFKRHDPTIQQILWRHSLASEVVDNQRAAV